MDKDKGVIYDPENYAKMCVPHASIEEAEAAWRGFWEAVYEARNKFRIQEAVVVGELSWKEPDGEAVTSIISGKMGSDVNALSMMASAYGRMKKDFQQKLLDLENPPTKKSKK